MFQVGDNVYFKLESSSSGGTTLKGYLDARKSTYNMFYNYPNEEVDIAEILDFNDTENVTDFSYMFQCPKTGCDRTIPLFNTSNAQNMENMFNNCRFIRELPLFDTSKVTSMQRFCYMGSWDNTILKTIPAYDMSNITISYGLDNAFYRCTALTSFLAYGMKVSFNISASTQFTREALVVVLNNLSVVTTTQTLTMGATNLAKLTDEDKAIATSKGWTLA